MDFVEFKNSLSKNHPPHDIKDELNALWHDANGDWKLAHRIVQDINSVEAAWVHAYLHRKAGDLGNASYWYSRAGKPVANTSLEEEWELLASSLL